MITSKLTTKSQTTIPQPVRSALGVSPGDELVYEISGDSVVLRSRRQAPADDPFRMFDEWASKADEDAYADL